MSSVDFRKFIVSSTLLLTAFTIAFQIHSRMHRLVPDSLALTPSGLSVGETQSISVGKDLRLLNYALDNGYAGKFANPDKFIELKNKLRDFEETHSAPITKSQFQVELNSIFQSFPDGHLSASTHFSQSTKSLIERAQPLIAEKINLDDFKQWSLNFTGKSDRIADLKITSFAMDDSETEDLISNLYLLARSDNLIVDLRGNLGGSIATATKLAAFIWGLPARCDCSIQLFPTPIKSVHTLYGSAAQTLQNNYWLLSTIQPDDVVRDFSHSPVQVPPDLHTETRDQEFPAGHKFGGYEGKIAILVDENCASACEKFVEYLEANPRAVTFGTRTLGAVKFGNIGILPLPESNLFVTLATSYVEYSDDRTTERTGYLPKRQTTRSDQALSEASAWFAADIRLPANEHHNSN